MGAFEAISGALYTRPTYAYTGDISGAISGDAIHGAIATRYYATDGHDT